MKNMKNHHEAKKTCVNVLNDPIFWRRKKTIYAFFSLFWTNKFHFSFCVSVFSCLFLFIVVFYLISTVVCLFLFCFVFRLLEILKQGSKCERKSTNLSELTHHANTIYDDFARNCGTRLPKRYSKKKRTSTDKIYLNAHTK